MSDAQEHEFDDIASWTADVLAGEERAVAIAAACRGSGSPGALAWLAESLGLGAGVRLLDVGSGLGGPGAWATDRYGAHVVGAEPMEGAVRGAARLFDQAAIVASADALPFPERAFDVAWTLGVLDTVDRPARVLAEVRRCLAVGGRFGIIAYVATEPIPDDEQPEGNDFPTREELCSMLDAAGFEVIDLVASGALPPIPAPWRERQDAADEQLERRHGDDERWRDARANEETFARLLDDGRVEAVLVVADSR